MKKRTEKQHYIPNKSYLDYFTDKTLKPPMLWAYFDKQQVLADASTAVPQNITPINFCKESYLYETPKLPVNAIENTFAKIEGDYKQVLEAKIIPRKKLTKSDRKKLAYFLSTLEVRTPLNKQHMENFIGQIREKVQHLEEAMGGGKKSELHEQLDQMEAQNVPFAQLQLGALDVNRYQYADFLFLVPQLEDEETFFITSDFPVSMIDFTNMNTFYPPTPMDATVEVTVPLTPKIALLVNNIGLNGYKEIDHNFIREINNRTLRRSNKFIISPQKFDEKFTDYNVRRSPQSFLLLFISDKLRAKRHKKVQKILKTNVSNLTRLISNDIINAGVKMYKTHTDKKNLTVISVSIYTQSGNEFGWFTERMDTIGKKFQETPIGFIYQLKKPIKTKSGLLSFVTIATPDQTRPQRGDVIFKVNSYDSFKKECMRKELMKVSIINGTEVLELTDENYNIFVYFSSAV